MLFGVDQEFYRPHPWPQGRPQILSVGADAIGTQPRFSSNGSHPGLRPDVRILVQVPDGQALPRAWRNRCL